MNRRLPSRCSLPARTGRRRVVAVGLSCAVVAICMAALADLALVNTASGYGFFHIGRDAFPVFDDPPMLSAAEAEGQGLIHPRDAVIGVAHGREAKAYPIAVMGIHELGNDTIDGVPIAVSW